MSYGTNTSNHHPLHPRDDREALSALFDGELPGDAARFALKRLDHDAGWRDACGRWQLIGDTLRGEATAAAPADFAAGVMRRLAAEGQVAMSAAPHIPVADAAPARASMRRRWFGGAALAASVAMAAVLVARPFSESSSTPAPAQVAASTAVPAAAPVQGLGMQSAEMAAPAAVSPAPVVAAIAAADASRTVRHRVSRAARAVQPAVDETLTAVAAIEPATKKPFHPQADEIATRPWPRAVLPETGEGSFTAGFETSTPTSSLYPFEPRQPEAAATKPTVTEPQR